MHGKDFSTNNGVTNITQIGFWILIENTEYFVPFDHYSCFKIATIRQITDFRIISPDQLYWESLDCDIELKALKDPQNYPLQFQK